MAFHKGFAREAPHQEQMVSLLPIRRLQRGQSMGFLAIYITYLFFEKCEFVNSIGSMISFISSLHHPFRNWSRGYEGKQPFVNKKRGQAKPNFRESFGES